MRSIQSMTLALIVLSLIAGCSTQTTMPHGKGMPDPTTFNAHFGDMDTDGDGSVVWEEFSAYFPNATPQIYQALDLNTDGGIDHDEWHAFKEAHGMRDHS